MIVVRCLQKPIDLRYASAEALADDLDAYLTDEKVSARSGRFIQVVARVFRETHHATVLENWGTLWIWHSMVLLVAGLFTWQFELPRDHSALGLCSGLDGRPRCLGGGVLETATTTRSCYLYRATDRPCLGCRDGSDRLPVPN